MEYDFSPILERIKNTKSKRELTNEELSKKSGIPLGTLSKLLAGIIKEPKIGTIISLSDALDVSTNFLVYGTELQTEITSHECTIQEQSHLKKYRALDKRGKETVDIVLDSQYELIQAKKETTCGLSDEEIEKELESYKQELLAEKKKKTLLVSDDIKGA